MKSEDIGEATIGEADKGAAEPEPVPAPVDVEEKSAEISSEDIGEGNESGNKRPVESLLLGAGLV